ncbi:MAG: malonyl-ACP O-methyltransferase BioC [Thiotrichaceae bacterium]|nr:malonyl-ACP O-methyltransferase BioC [Thiotrichaceae bacterium]
MSLQIEKKLDFNKRRLGFERSASGYDAAAVLQNEVGTRLLDRLALMTLQPKRVLDLGSGTGFMTKHLLKTYPKSEHHAVDIAFNMAKQTQRYQTWRRKVYTTCATAEALPYASESFDMVISNLMLQWCDDLSGVFTDIHRILRAEGGFIFTSFGTDTMIELRESWKQVDDYEHTHRFVDIHDVGDALMQTGFQQPVLDMEKITLTYTSLPKMFRDIKAIGATNASLGRNKGLTGKGAFKKLELAYEAFRTEDGLYPLTYEVIYGHGWGQSKVGLYEGRAIIPITPVG